MTPQPAGKPPVILAERLDLWLSETCKCPVRGSRNPQARVYLTLSGPR